ncbi:MAG TPA: hypothetical protein VES88_09405 [Gemmatimonadaceae bacterium]|nr:hypothetical protein [Gemmatimonadaceae bacterium]
MKATDSSSVVVLDTNVYRRLGRGRSDHDAQRKGRGLASRDALGGVQALLHPFVILELVSHLADIQDPEWTDCRAALIVAWHHCQTESDEESKFLAVINDSETAICRLAYQLDPPGHAAVSERLATLCKRVATSSPEEAKTLGHSDLVLWSNQAAEIENEFVSDMMQHIIREHIPDAVAWDALKRDPAKRRELWKS